MKVCDKDRRLFVGVSIYADDFIVLVMTCVTKISVSLHSKF